ncbi:nucleotide exchange factor GrpE [Phenylobacterium aquaticum]|uniref:nucleotide exchange factor GrpE n=1 Tax=Phenylobacterium aquaticum TaxID=1763816 RepID=UPI001F5C4905|nr:nucleotide exchange factor GrpE [Phenylobacterium aquaticum]MCI3135578.1 nucleotide exchange factor GrpE [Phenylobacterium aquaticum]
MSDDQTPAEELDAVAEATLSHMEALNAEIAALKEQVLRYAADAENTKRRAEREANDARAYAIQKFARDLLGVADTLARALAAPPASADPAVKNFLVGVEMTEKALLNAFESNGLKRVEPAKGTKFDPHQHQAMMEQPSEEVAGGAVIQTLQAGYELLGRLVRPAMVVVATKGSGAEAAPDGGGANPYAKAPAEADPDAGASVDRKA